ncbi:hypothetical protein D3C72_886680 [compost metagenome]
MQGAARGIGAQCFFQDFFCLQVTAISQIDIGFGNRVHITRIQLAGGIGQRGCTRRHGADRRIDVLTTAGAEEGVLRQAAFHDRIRNSSRSFLALLVAVPQATQQSDYGQTARCGQ